MYVKNEQILRKTNFLSRINNDSNNSLQKATQMFVCLFLFKKKEFIMFYIYFIFKQTFESTIFHINFLAC